MKMEVWTLIILLKKKMKNFKLVTFLNRLHKKFLVLGF